MKSEYKTLYTYLYESCCPIVFSKKKKRKTIILYVVLKNTNKIKRSWSDARWGKEGAKASVKRNLKVIDSAGWIWSDASSSVGEEYSNYYYGSSPHRDNLPHAEAIRFSTSYYAYRISTYLYDEHLKGLPKLLASTSTHNSPITASIDTWYIIAPYWFGDESRPQIADWVGKHNLIRKRRACENLPDSDWIRVKDCVGKWITG